MDAGGAVAQGEGGYILSAWPEGQHLGEAAEWADIDGVGGLELITPTGERHRPIDRRDEGSVGVGRRERELDVFGREASACDGATQRVSTSSTSSCSATCCGGAAAT